MREDRRFSKLVGRVEQSTMAAPTRRGDQTAVTGDFLRVMSVVIRDIDFSDARPRFHFKSNFRLGDRNQPKLLRYCIRERMGAQALTAPGIGPGEHLLVVHLSNEPSFHPS